MSLALRIFLYLSGFALVAALGVAIAAGLYVYALVADLPDYQALQRYEPPTTTRVHAGDGSLVAEFARERRLFVPIEDIPPRVIEAFLSAEDKNFYEHPGVDFWGVVRASFDNVNNYLQGRRLEGASTITQQVAKNFLLSSEVSIDRKIKEALLAFRIEDAYPKKKILELYLNEIYLGSGSYGVAAAALNYFDKALTELSVAEMAYLAALPKAPNNYHPIRARERGIERRNWVIGQMLENGYITPSEAKAAMEDPLHVQMRPPGTQNAEVEYFAEEVRRTIMQRYGEQSLYDGGLVVRSTVDPKLQAAGLAALRTGLIAYDQRHGWRGPVSKIDLGEGWEKRLSEVPRLADVTEWTLAVVTRLRDDNSAIIGLEDGSQGVIPFDGMNWAKPFISDRSVGAAPTKASDILGAGDVVYVERRAEGDATYLLRQVPAVNGALVALDPHTGRVLAAVGGFSYFKSEFNRATQALRQTGSTFKPIVYAAALDHGYTPSSIVMDAPFVIEQGPGLPLWKPENYSHNFLGPTTLRVGLSLSRNLMTVRLAHALGMDVVAGYAERLGATDNMEPVLAMSLGAKDTTLLALTSAFAVFANGGRRVEPTFIDRVQNRSGETIYRHDDRACAECNADQWQGQEEPALSSPGKDVLDARTAYQVVSLLQGVVQYGTGTAVKDVGVPLAGKTGTTNDEKDAWFIGFAPDLVAGVYIGFDQPRPMGRGETGGAVAAPVFRDFMKVAVGTRPAIPFRIPPGIELIRVNRKTGLTTSADDPYAILEAFKAGETPESGTDLVEGEYAASGVVDDPAAYGSRPVAPASTVTEGTGGLY
ncbi:MAG: PBP1A family penicillin-binding protein [Alphaproteobacteria bacterium]|nr:PBP1A family penicillin-binding protein [Alphaproteobacteria bacterium]